MSRWLHSAMAVALALVVSACGYAGLDDLPLPGSPEVGDHPRTVEADFASVLNLAENSTVRLDGVTVGRVEEIRRQGWHARVTMRVDGDVWLPEDVKARITQTSLLGEKYVALEVPASSAARRLPDGARLTEQATSRGREVEEVLGALSLLLNGGGVGQLQTVTTELKDALGDDGAARRFVTELDTLVTTLDRNRSVIISSLEHVNDLSAQLARQHETVEQAITSISHAVDAMAEQRAEIVTMLRRLDRFSQVASDVVRRSGADLVANLRALEPVLAQLDRAGNDIPAVLEFVLSFPFPDEVLDAVKGDFVNLDVLMDLSPLVLAGNSIGDDEQLPGTIWGPLIPKPGTTSGPWSIPGLTPGDSGGPAPALGPVSGLLSGPLFADGGKAGE